jgi:outer membrane protein assembly factor BamA
LFLLCSLTVVSAQRDDSLLVKDIYISGNKLTHSQVILREISFYKGERLTKQGLEFKMAQSEKFLFNQSLFLLVTIKDSMSGSDAYIYIKVIERFNIDFWHPQVKIAAQNLNEWLRSPSLYRLTYGLPVYISNVSGLNDRLTLEAIFGWRQTYAVEYRTPFLDKAKTLVIDAAFAYQQGHEVGACTQDNHLQYIRVDARNIFYKTGFESDLIYRKKYQVSHVIAVGFDYYNIDTAVRNANPDYLGSGKTIARVPRIAYRFVYDKRDYVVYARKGDLIAGSIEQDGLPILFKDVNITTLDLTYRKFIPMGGRFYYEGGFTSEYDLQSKIPYIFRSSLGYRYQVRGFDHYLSDGRAYVLVENELKYLAFSRYFHIPRIKEGQFNPVPVNIYIKLFADQGSVFYNDTGNENTLLNKLMNGWGAGIDITSYYDFVMRIEYSFPNYGKSGWFLHFTEVL